MASMERNMNQVIESGRQLVDEGIPGNEQILGKIAELEDEWDQLKQLANARKLRLIGGVDYYQVIDTAVFSIKLQFNITIVF